MSGRTRSLVGLLVVIAGLGSSAPGVDAAKTVTSGAYSCTVTAVTPSLSKTTLTARATVFCTVATSVSVEIGAVELDGTTQTQIIPQTLRSITVKARTNASVSVAGACRDSDPGEKEEYATKVMIRFGTSAWSAYDLTVPATNAYAC